MTLALGHYGPVHGGMPSAQRYESSQLVAMAIAVQQPCCGSCDLLDDDTKCRIFSVNLCTVRMSP